MERVRALLVADGVAPVTTYSLTIPGRAVPQGSKRHIGGGRLIEASKKLRPWRKHVTAVAQNAPQRPRQMIHGAVRVDALVTFQRPKSHFTGKGALKRTAPEYPGKSYGDSDKLLRALLDALGDARFYADDSQATDARCRKRFGDEDYVSIIVEEL